MHVLCVVQSVVSQSVYNQQGWIFFPYAVCHSLGKQNEFHMFFFSETNFRKKPGN